MRLLSLLLLVAMALGPGRVEQPLDNGGRRELTERLRQSDYAGARLVALRFAHRLTRNQARAQDLMGRADLRLVRLGWNQEEVTLVQCLCRYVWSEWTHATSETQTARRAEEVFVADRSGAGEVAPVAPAVDERLERRLAALRAQLEKTGDVVNLEWLEQTAAGEDDLSVMAARTGRVVEEFYAAAKRRKRAVRRVLAEERGVVVAEGEEG